MNVRSSRTLVTGAVLVGLTPLIPIPVVDDLARIALRRRLVRELAAETGKPLSEAEVEALAGEERGGCLLGCPAMLIVYPLKKLFRKIFFFLEIKRAIDLVSTSYHFGWLVSVALAEERVGGGDVGRAVAARTAIDGAVDEASVKPVERAFREVLTRSRGVMKGAAEMLSRTLRGTARDVERVEEAVEQVEPQEEMQIAGIVSRLQAAISQVPAEHFDRLRAAFVARIEAPNDPRPSEPGTPA